MTSFAAPCLYYEPLNSSRAAKILFGSLRRCFPRVSAFFLRSLPLRVFATWR